MKATIILASQSVGRRAQFERAKLTFEIIVSEVDESAFKASISDPIELVEKLAQEKAKNVQAKVKNRDNLCVIIGADSLAEFNGEIIGKAHSEEKAFHILKKLGGKTHCFITGVAVTDNQSSKMSVSHTKTSVTFKPLSDEEIWGYIRCGEWKGRAGAYSSRDKASMFIESIEGSPSNVIGIPMHLVHQILKEEYDINLLDMK